MAYPYPLSANLIRPVSKRLWQDSSSEYSSWSVSIYFIPWRTVDGIGCMGLLGRWPKLKNWKTSCLTRPTTRLKVFDMFFEIFHFNMSLHGNMKPMSAFFMSIAFSLYPRWVTGKQIFCKKERPLAKSLNASYVTLTWYAASMPKSMRLHACSIIQRVSLVDTHLDMVSPPSLSDSISSWDH